MPDYRSIVSFYEKCFEQYGDGHQGHHWPNFPDLMKRYEVMLELIKEKDRCVQSSLLDFGCGTAMLYEYLLKNRPDWNIQYSGLDLSAKFIEKAKKKYPNAHFYLLDVIENPENLRSFDYIIMNGVVTEKFGLPFEDMLDYFKNIVRNIFPKCNKGLAFNLMSKHVDWEKESLFHVPFDTLANFLSKELTRNFVIRNDYGLFEFTTYIYK